MNGFFTNETLRSIGAKHGKDNAQVALKFLTDEGIIVIPKSTHKERMVSNLALDDFTLTDDERDAIRRLDGGKPLMADFNDPVFARYLLNYSK